MKPTLKLQQVHLWRVFVPDFIPQVSELLSLLNAEEQARAARFKFDIHRQRFTVARAFLRKILSLYLETSPETIEFSTGERGKPYLSVNSDHLQFNLSHSHDLAVYAVSLQTEVGVDVEKIEPGYSAGVAEHFFSMDENKQLAALPVEERVAAFYQFWAGKEAVLKALGAGLYASSTEFTMDLLKMSQQVVLTHQDRDHVFQLDKLAVHADYQAACAAAGHIREIDCWQWTLAGFSQFDGCESNENGNER